MTVIFKLHYKKPFEKLQYWTFHISVLSNYSRFRKYTNSYRSLPTKTSSFVKQTATFTPDVIVHKLPNQMRQMCENLMWLLHENHTKSGSWLSFPFCDGNSKRLENPSILCLSTASRKLRNPHIFKYPVCDGMTDKSIHNETDIFPFSHLSVSMTPGLYSYFHLWIKYEAND